MVQEVIDPGVLAQLEGGGGKTEVQDPGVLEQLNGGAVSNTIAAPKPVESALPAMWDRFKGGFANSVGMMGEAAKIVAPVITGAVAAFQPKDKKNIASTQGGSEAMKSSLGVTGKQMPTDVYGKVSKNNEYLGTIAEFLGGALIPEAGAIAMAERKLVTATVGALGTVMSATGQVEGKEFAENHAAQFGMDKEKAGAVGGFLGSLTGPGLVGMAAQQVLKKTNAGANMAAKANITGTSPEAQRAAANTMLTKEIQTALEHAPESPSNVARSIELQKKIDNFKPNAAQQTDAAGLKASYKDVANRSPEAMARANEVEQANLAAVAAYKEKVFPKSTLSPLDPVRTKANADRVVANLEQKKLENQMRELSDKFERNVDNQQVGEQLRKLYWDNRGRVKGQLDSELREVYLTAKAIGIKEDMTDVRDGVKRMMASDRETFQDTPSAFAKVLREYPEATPATMERVAKTPQGASKPLYQTVTTPGKPGNSTASFEELHSLYKEANRGWQDAIAGGRPDKARYMQVLKDQLQAKISKYNDPMYGDLAKQFSSFNENYAKYSTTFRQGAGGAISKRTSNGLSTDAEDIVSKLILRPGDKKKGVQDFNQLFGKDERAAELLHDGMLDNFSKAAVKDGMLQPKLAQSWIDKHKQALDELPELAKALKASTEKGTDLVNRQLMLQKQGRVYDRTVVAKIARSENSEAVISHALEHPKEMKALLMGAHTEDSKKSVARAVADAVGAKPDAYDFLVKNEATVKPAMDALGKNHWQNLKDIAEAGKSLARTKAPTEVLQQKALDLGEELAGTSIKSLWAKSMEVRRGRAGTGFTLIDVAGRFGYKIRSEEFNRLRTQAMIDPEMAKTVLTMMKQSTAPTKAQLLRLQDLSFAAGINSIAQAQGGHEGREK